MLLLVLFIACVSANCNGGPSRTVRGDASDEAAHAAAAEGISRFNKFLRETRDIHDIPHPAERTKKRQDNLQEIGSPSTFVLETHPWTDANMVHGRLIWSQIQDFKERCGGTYLEDWCLPVIRFIENGIGYRELQLAVMAAHAPLETVGYAGNAYDHQQQQEDGSQQHEKRGETDPRLAYRRALENFVDIARAQEQQSSRMRH